MKPQGIKRDVSLTSQDWKDINIETFRNKLDSFEAFAKEESEKQKQEEGPVRRQSSGALVNDESRVTRDISSKGLDVLDPDIRRSKSIYGQRHESLHVSTAFGPYLPAILRQQLLSSNTATHLPTFQSVLGTVLIADISGFTKLGEKLREKYGEGEPPLFVSPSPSSPHFNSNTHLLHPSLTPTTPRLQAKARPSSRTILTASCLIS